ncbi:MAG: hypothetical protein AVDCRST_MAG73-797, partial [uncultured Thermomicrobiales bacterium]
VHTPTPRPPRPGRRPRRRRGPVCLPGRRRHRPVRGQPGAALVRPERDQRAGRVPAALVGRRGGDHRDALRRLAGRDRVGDRVADPALEPGRGRLAVGRRPPPPDGGPARPLAARRPRPPPSRLRDDRGGGRGGRRGVAVAVQHGPARPARGAPRDQPLEIPPLAGAGVPGDGVRV